MATDPDVNRYLLSPKEFILEMPLYVGIMRDDPAIDKQVCELLKFSETIDAHCIWCKKESVFNAEEYYGHDYGTWDWTEGEGFIRISYVCTRDDNHKYFVYFFKKKTEIIKIGQFPSVADFQIPQAEKYRVLLGEERYKELTRGIGLAAHGVGIGSFVYLRRIFENLIEDAHVEASKKRFAEKKYLVAKMDEKIKLLKDYLPDFLVDNRVLYRILSLGIHELKEEECLKYFDTVRIGIEQILDEKIIQDDKKRKAEEAKKAILSITQEVSQKPSEAVELVKGFEIIKGTYGAAGNNIDITQKLIELITDGKLITAASNALVTKDPAGGVVKTLTIEYIYNGVSQTRQFQENDQVSLP